MKYDRLVKKEVAAGYPQEGESVLCAGRRQEAVGSSSSSSSNSNNRSYSRRRYSDTRSDAVREEATRELALLLPRVALRPSSDPQTPTTDHHLPLFSFSLIFGFIGQENE